MKYVEKIMDFVCNIVAYILLYVFNPGHEWNEVTEGRMRKKSKVEYGEDIPEEYYDDCLGSYRTQFTEQKDRVNINNRKCETLLTANSILFAAQIAIITYLQANFAFLLSIVGTASSIFLILYRDRVSAISYPDETGFFCKPNISKTDMKKEMVRDIRSVIENNDCVINFKIGLYSASRRILMLSIFFLIILIFIYFMGNPSSKSKAPAIHNLYIMSETDTPISCCNCCNL